MQMRIETTNGQEGLRPTYPYKRRENGFAKKYHVIFTMIVEISW